MCLKSAPWAEFLIGAREMTSSSLYVCVCVWAAEHRGWWGQWRMSSADAQQEAESSTATAYLPKQLENSPPPSEGGQRLTGLTGRETQCTHTHRRMHTRAQTDTDTNTNTHTHPPSPSIRAEITPNLFCRTLFPFLSV